MAQINESAIKTPGVYVNEIPSFPPSIAQVATAVPAFIGYTQDATRLQKADLSLQPTRITSLVEYQHYFGFGPNPGIEQVDIDASNAVLEVKRHTTYYLYDSIRLFFLNGGSVCYIISIGLYLETASYNSEDFLAGLEALKKYDEPTLILFPDAVLLSGTKLYDVQYAALKQCNELQDRFCILDMAESPDWEIGKEAFRNNIGVSFLNYGAAYTPYLKTSLGLKINYKNLDGGVIKQAGVGINLKTYTTSTNVLNTIESYDRLIADTGTINTNLSSLLTGKPNLQQKWLALLNDYKASYNTSVTPPTDDESKFQALLNFLYDIANLADDWAVNLTSDLEINAVKTGLKIDVQKAIENTAKTSVSKLVAYDRGASTRLGAGYYSDRGTLTTRFTSPKWDTLFTAPPAEDVSVYGSDAAAPEPVQRYASLPAFTVLFNQLNVIINGVLNLVASYETAYEQSLLQTLPVYKQIVAAVQDTQSALPPSGAIAGIYATVDGTRGVWKAPANMSLTGVSGLTFAIDDGIQDDLNIDTNAGKSINAIRAFTGKGILVWGARTLDGNSNDWRYISVRRLYIMVEESVKKAAMQFVFEPNDANTWVRIRAMVENYLTNLWRLGALAGAKPEQAFYVKVGLGQTMTFDDILNGKMIVEIGMAPVRPAEFIILRFSQIQQQA